MGHCPGSGRFQDFRRGLGSGDEVDSILRVSLAVLLEPDLDLAPQLAWYRRFRAAEEGREAVLLGTHPELAGHKCEDELVEVRGTRAVIDELTTRKVSLLLMFRRDDRDGQKMRMRLWRRVSCAIVVLRCGVGEPSEPLHALVPVAGGEHALVALRVARALVGEEGSATALYVEPDIGYDAQLVGEKVLGRIVSRAFGKDADCVQQRVAIADGVRRGIVSAHGEREYDLILFGASKLNELTQRFRGTVALRVTKALPDQTIGIVRAPAPITGRLRSLAESWVLRAVPQLEREQRVSLVERVQSNSSWDFDFVALMSMATFIAAIGLVQSSEAVVIGAMLVAPLMTPILGLGLALVHGNPVLARHAWRSVTFGFMTAFGIGLVLGLCVPRFAAPTVAMVARDWPGMLDLIVAFVAGFAGAYATSRPSLFAALPGVAIAAALVPPIATSGLAAALGDWSLMTGASLLFFTNMVAIILASSLCLWSVGMREIKPKSRNTVRAGNALVVVVLLLGVWFATTPPRHVPAAFREAVEARVVDEFRVRSIAIDTTVVPPDVVVSLGGARQPPASIANDVDLLVRQHFESEFRVRVEWEWESHARR